MLVFHEVDKVVTKAFSNRQGRDVTRQAGSDVTVYPCEEEASMSAPLNPSDTDKLFALQEQCDHCKEAIVSESNIPLRTQMQKVCEKCQKVRLRVPQLMELKRKLHAVNAEGGTSV
jgi:hypothetical protein